MRTTYIISMLTLIISIVIVFSSCGITSNDELSLNTSNSLADSIIVDSDLNMDNLIISVVKVKYPDSMQNSVYDLLFVLTDGSIYTAKYSMRNNNENELRFFANLYSCDKDILRYIQDVEWIEKISEVDLQKLKNNISAIDINSKSYDRDIDDIGLSPDVEESVDYHTYVYFETETGKSSYHIQSRGESRGVSYETNDYHGIEILELLNNSNFYKDWAYS